MEGIPITGRRQRIHCVTGKDRKAPGWPTYRLSKPSNSGPGSTALVQPCAPALAAAVVVLPLHQRTAGGGLRVRGEPVARAERDCRRERTLDQAGPAQAPSLGPGRRAVAAVGCVSVLGGPAFGRHGVDPGVGIAATRCGGCQKEDRTAVDQCRSARRGIGQDTVEVPDPSRRAVARRPSADIAYSRG